jgi:hypothetical protein
MAGPLRLLDVPAQEADPMMRKTFSALMLIAALGSTAFVPTAQAATRDRRAPVAQFYDRGYRDYRTWNGGGNFWNGGGNFAYRGYLSNQRRPYDTFSRLNRNQPQNSWRWRHDGR